MKRYIVDRGDDVARVLDAWCERSGETPAATFSGMLRRLLDVADASERNPEIPRQGRAFVDRLDREVRGTEGGERGSRT